MAEICPICGLPNDICVCKEIGKEQQRIRVRVEIGKWRRKNTILEGIDKNEIAKIVKTLKAFCACGGTAKNGQILLQGDHRDRVVEYLLQLGYPKDNIELQ